MRKLWSSPLLAITTCLLATILCYLQIRQQITIDEPDILNYVGQSAKPLLSQSLKYGYSVYFFYKVLLTPLFWISPDIDVLFWGRLINLSLFFFVCLLFYFYARRYFSSFWPNIALFAFAFAPSIFYSGVIVKTDTLQLLCFLLFLLAAENIYSRNHKLKWHALALAMSILSLDIKTNPCPMLTYFVLCFLRYLHPIRKAGRNRIILFIAGLLVCTLISYFYLDFFFRRMTFFKNDNYFLPGPAVFKAVDERWSFPYGRYSSALFTTFPMAFGPVAYFVSIAGIFMGKDLPKNLLLTIGVSGLAFIAMSLPATLLRVPHSFMILGPAFIMFCIFRLASMRNRLLCVGLTSLLFFTQILTHASISSMYYDFFDTLKEARATGARYYLTNSISSDNFAAAHPFDPDIEQDIEQSNPETFVVLDSYFYNFCKYRNNPSFTKNCTFFHDLLLKKTRYRFLKSSRIELPARWLYFDPETSLTFYWFQRSMSKTVSRTE